VEAGQAAGPGVYHHFCGKKGLFQAAERIEAEILGHAGVVDESNRWLRLRLGFEKPVDFCAAADVRRIIFVEAPQGRPAGLVRDRTAIRLWSPQENLARTKGDPNVRAQISDLVVGFFATLEPARPLTGRDLPKTP
jgi:hypothetical protein